MRGIIIATVIGCLALIGVAIFFTVNSPGAGPRLTPLAEQYTKRVEEGYWKKGPEQPKVTMTEYLDYQCPGCGALSSVVDEAVRQTTEFVEYRVRMYPLISIHNKAQVAARAAEAAGRQGKFWEMHDILFANQQGWESAAPASFRTTVLSYAESLQLNSEQFKQDLDDQNIDEAIDRDKTAGNRIPVQGTPTLLINDRVITNLPQTAEELVKLLTDARDGA
jgi:protein-disulfide isomerase